MRCRLISFMVYIILFLRKPEASENVELRTDDKCMHHSGHCCARLHGERGGGSRCTSTTPPQGLWEWRQVHAFTFNKPKYSPFTSWTLKSIICIGGKGDRSVHSLYFSLSNPTILLLLQSSKNFSHAYLRGCENCSGSLSIPEAV